MLHHSRARQTSALFCWPFRHKSRTVGPPTPVSGVAMPPVPIKVVVLTIRPRTHDFEDVTKSRRVNVCAIDRVRGCFSSCCVSKQQQAEPPTATRSQVAESLCKSLPRPDGNHAVAGAEVSRTVFCGAGAGERNSLLATDLRASQRLCVHPEPMNTRPTLSEEDKVDLLRAARPTMSSGALRVLLRQTDGNVDRVLSSIYRQYRMVD